MTTSSPFHMTGLLTTIWSCDRCPFLELKRLHTNSYTHGYMIVFWAPHLYSCLLYSVVMWLVFCDLKKNFWPFSGIYSNFWQKLPTGKNSLLTSHLNDHHIKYHKIRSDHMSPQFMTAMAYNQNCTVNYLYYLLNLFVADLTARWPYWATCNIKMKPSMLVRLSVQ